MIYVTVQHNGKISAALINSIDSLNTNPLISLVIQADSINDIRMIYKGHQGIHHISYEFYLDMINDFIGHENYLRVIEEIGKNEQMKKLTYNNDSRKLDCNHSKNRRENHPEMIRERLLLLSEKGTCKRLKVGAMIFSEENELLSVGYNTSVEGTPSCEDEDNCLLNDEGRCYRTIHAEVNAIIRVSQNKLKNAKMYVSHEPCENCLKLINQVGISYVYHIYEYKNINTKMLKLSIQSNQL